MKAQSRLKNKILHPLQSIVMQIEFSFFCRLTLQFVFRVKFNNTKYLREQKQFIIVANHTSHMDTVCLLSSMPNAKIVSIKPVSARDYFGKNKFQAAISNFFINTLLIDRKFILDAREQFVEKLIEALDEGYSLIIFPEGTRSKTGTMQKLKYGISYVLQDRSDIHYIPTYLRGMRYLLSFKNVFRSSNASVTFGTPTLISSQNNTEIMSEIKNKLDELAKREPDLGF